MAVVTRMKGGLDLGGTKIQAVVTNGESTVLGSARRETPRKGGPQAVAFELAEALRAALDDAGVEPMGLAGIGIGAPGSIDADSGTVLQVANIEGWDDPFPLGPTLAAELGRPVRIGNDVNVAVDAEHRYGAGRGLDSFLGVFWGTGVGGGIVMDGAQARRAAARPARSGTCARSPAAAVATAGSRVASRRTPAAVRSRSGHASSPRSARRCCST